MTTQYVAPAGQPFTQPAAPYSYGAEAPLGSYSSLPPQYAQPATMYAQDPSAFAQPATTYAQPTYADPSAGLSAMAPQPFTMPPTTGSFVAAAPFPGAYGGYPSYAPSYGLGQDPAAPMANYSYTAAPMSTQSFAYNPGAAPNYQFQFYADYGKNDMSAPQPAPAKQAAPAKDNNVAMKPQGPVSKPTAKRAVKDPKAAKKKRRGCCC